MTERIRLLKWEGAHEVSQSRKNKRALAWVAMPTRQSMGYCRLVAEHGAMGLGVWLALVQLAASRDQEKRGTINGGPDEIATMARLSSHDVGSVLPTLSQIGWIRVESPANSHAPTALPAPYQGSTTPVAHGQTDRQTDRQTPHTPRKRGDPLLRRFKKGGSPPDGHASWDTFFADLARSWNVSAEAARDLWVKGREGDAA